MKLKIIDYDFSVCQISDISEADLNKEFTFFAKTDGEISLVCKTCDVPDNAVNREDGWRAFRIEGVLDFSLVGILAKISSILAQNGIGIFVVSTYNTDYILTKSENLEKALNAVKSEGYKIV